LSKLNTYHLVEAKSNPAGSLATETRPSICDNTRSQ